MRTAILLLAATTGLAILACDHSSTPTAPMDPVLAADPNHVTRFDGSHTFVGCDGHTILVENHEQFVTSFRGTDQHGHLQLHIIEINSTATDLTTGATQTFHGAENEAANGDFTADVTPGEFNLELHQTFTSPGTQATHLVIAVHITINQNGVVVVDRETPSASC